MQRLWNRFRYCRKYIVLAITDAILLGLVSSTVLAQEQIALYGLFEKSIDYQALLGQPHPYVDPFYGVELEATFASPSGRLIDWWGFFDGDGQGGQNGNVWKLRFMPDELGTWNFTWQFSDGSLSGGGSLLAVDNASNPRKPGPLKRDPNIHQWFMTADGSQHVFLNMYNPRDANKTVLEYQYPDLAIAEVKDNGFDVIFTHGAAHWFYRDQPMDEDNPYPFVNTSSFTPRLQGWHVLENGLWQNAYEQGIYVYEFLGFYGGNGLYNLHTKSLSFQNNVVKYWLARTAPYYIFLYNIGFELPEYVSVPSWPVERAQFVRNIDPWDHLITGHELHGWSYGNSPVMGFSALQNNDNFHGRALAVWNSSSKPHPHCNECIWNNSNQGTGTEGSHRKDLWNGITGGMSYAFLWVTTNDGLTSFRHANAFLKNGVKWWTMAPHDEIKSSGTAYVLANPGVEYVVYSSSGNSFSLDLLAGNYQQRWFNPANGTYSEWTSLNALDGSTVFNKPNSNDWVLHISSSGATSSGPLEKPTDLVVK